MAEPILSTKTGEQIEIPLSKKKLALMLTGSLVFVAMGFWFVIKRPTARGFSNPTEVFIAGLASILFFGLCAMLISMKIMENTPGLIINNEGITDNSSGVSAGLILWKDIRAIRKTTVVNQAIIVIIVNNPEEYIARQKGLIKRKAMEMNYKTYDSPINISANGLMCNSDELYATLLKEFNYRNPGMGQE